MKNKTKKALDKYQRKIDKKGLKINAFEMFKSLKERGFMSDFPDGSVIRQTKYFINFEYDVDLTYRQIKKKKNLYIKLKCLYGDKIDDLLEAEIQSLFRFIQRKIKFIWLSLSLTEIYFPRYMKDLDRWQNT